MSFSTHHDVNARVLSVVVDEVANLTGDGRRRKFEVVDPKDAVVVLNGLPTVVTVDALSPS